MTDGGSPARRAGSREVDTGQPVGYGPFRAVPDSDMTMEQER